MDIKDFPHMWNPGSIAGPDHRDDLEEAMKATEYTIDQANANLDMDYERLLKDFDLTLGGFRQESRQTRAAETARQRQDLEADTNAFMASVGPLNASTEARLRTQIRAPLLAQLMEYDLGTYDNDIDLGLSHLMGVLTLEREQNLLKSQARAIKTKNKGAFEAMLDAQPNDLERWLTGTMRGMQMVAAAKGLV